MEKWLIIYTNLKILLRIIIFLLNCNYNTFSSTDELTDLVERFLDFYSKLISSYIIRMDRQGRTEDSKRGGVFEKGCDNRENRRTEFTQGWERVKKNLPSQIRFHVTFF